MSKDFVWQSPNEEPNHYVKVQRPCECGCDFRDGDFGIGYLIGGLGNGKGFTIWIETEEVYQRLRELIGGEE